MEAKSRISKAQDGQCADEEQTRTVVCVPSELEGQRRITVDSSTGKAPQENLELLSALEDCFTEMVEAMADLTNLKIKEKINPSPAELIVYFQQHDVEMDEGLTLRNKRKQKEECYLKIFVQKVISQKVILFLEENSAVKRRQPLRKEEITNINTPKPQKRTIETPPVNDLKIPKADGES
jgi:hypothetical protein